MKGSWDNWTTEICIQQGHVYIKLLPGVYQFKFIVDGIWMVDKGLMKHEGENGVENNIIKIKVFFLNLLGEEFKPVIFIRPS